MRRTTRPAAWAKKVCDKWQPELKKIETASTDIKRVATQSSQPDEVKTTDSAAFGTMSESYKAMGAALQGAGVPPVEDGQTTQAAAIKSFEETSKGYADLKTKMDGLDPQDKTKFAAGLKEVAAWSRGGQQGRQGRAQHAQVRRSGQGDEQPEGLPGRGAVAVGEVR